MSSFNLATHVRAGIRKAFKFSPLHKEALRRARYEGPILKKDGSISKRVRVDYLCSKCDDLFKLNEVEVHHIVKVGPAPGTRNAPDELTWDEFIGRVFCPVESLMVVCKDCHRQLTREGK